MTLTTEQLSAMKSGKPIRLKLPDVETECVLVRADVFDAICDEADDDLNPAETYPAFLRIAGPAGWDDPEMNVYD
ncbi:MAG TPA: hypothetical protein VK137_17120 [Planctomycetaceae bacterium]|nr:hypothetical protein [Planctomycetaceae bacterium]